MPEDEGFVELSFYVDDEGVVRLPEALRLHHYYLHGTDLEHMLTKAYELALTDLRTVQ